MRRPVRHAVTLVGLLVCVLMAGACASAGAAGSGDGIVIRVRNDLVPALSVSISATVQGGSPVRLGTLMSGGEETFTYRPTVGAGTFRLVADRPGPSGALVSEPIPLEIDEGTTIEWELSTNNVVIR